MPAPTPNPTCYGEKGHGHPPTEMYATEAIEETHGGEAYRCSNCRAVIVTAPEPAAASVSGSGSAESGEEEEDLHPEVADTRSPAEWENYLIENPDMTLLCVDTDSKIHEIEFDEHLGHVTFLVEGTRGYDYEGTRAALEAAADTPLKPVPREQVRAERKRLADGEYETHRDFLENTTPPQEVIGE